MFGLLGPNGESTLMRIIATLQEPDEGSIRLGDIDVLRQTGEVRKTLGYLPQSFGFYRKVRADRSLEHFAVLKGIAEPGAKRDVVESLLRRTKLWEVHKQRLGTFSSGTRQRFGVAVALLGNPQADHRRRAYRGARSDRARPLPEPAGRDRRRSRATIRRRAERRTMTVIMSTTTMVLILGAIVFSAAGHLLLKSATQHADLGRLEFLLVAVRDIRVLSGLAAWIAWTICWLYVLRVAPLSRAYGLTSLTYVIIPLASIYVFGEHVRRRHHSDHRGHRLRTRR